MQRRRERVAGALAVVALLGAGGAAGACSVFTSLDGLTGGSGSDGGGEDATFPQGDANGIVASDGGASDAGDATVPVDAGMDSPVAHDGGGPPYCASLSPKPLFCDDFDEPDVLGSPPWDQVSSLNGSVTVSNGQWLSPPGSMRAATIGGMSDYDCAAYQSFPAVAPGALKPYVYTFSFDVYVAESDTSVSSASVLAAFQFYDAAGERYDLQLESVAYNATATPTLSLDMSEDAHFVDGGESYFSHPTSASLTLATWTRVSLSFTYEAGAYSATWTIGKATAGSFTPNIPFAYGTPEILVGLPYVQPANAAWEVYYDDVTFDAKLL